MRQYCEAVHVVVPLSEESRAASGREFFSLTGRAIKMVFHKIIPDPKGFRRKEGLNLLFALSAEANRIRVKN